MNKNQSNNRPSSISNNCKNVIFNFSESPHPPVSISNFLKGRKVTNLMLGNIADLFVLGEQQIV